MPTITRVFATALLTATFILGATEASFAQTSPTPVPSHLGEQQGQEENKPPPWDVSGRAEYGINSWIRGLIASALDPVMTFLGKTILATPRLDRQERVRELWRFSLVVANASLILFVLVGAGVVMVGGLSSQLTLKELLPRMFFAGLMVNFGLILTGELISIANALSLAVLGAATDPSDISGQIAERIHGAGMASPLFLLFALVVLVLAVLVIVAYIVRVAVLVVLLAGGPLFLVTHCLPQTDQIARTWWRLVAAMIASPVLQAFVLTTAVKVFLSGDGVLGLTTGGFVDLLIIGCLLYLLYRIPLWTINVALRGAGSRAWSSAKEKAVVAVKAAAAA